MLLVCLLACICKSAPSALAADVNMSTSVQGGINLSLSTSSLSLGNLTPGTPVRGSGGVDIDVTTSSETGYNLYINDYVSSTNSALLHTDLSTRIPDFSSLISSPSAWVSGTSTGLGFTVYYAQTSKETSQWGLGTTYNDSNNKYAGVPENATKIHASPDYKASADRTSIAFMLDTTNAQKTGSYSGVVTITATAIVNQSFVSDIF